MTIAQSGNWPATLAARLRIFLLVFTGLALVSGCGNRMDTAPLVAGAIVITTPDGAVPVTGTMQFVATVTDANGNVIALAPTWTVVNGGGTITSDGLFTAGDVSGTFENTIVATSGSATATSSVTVSAGALSTISVHPSTVTLARGAVQQFTATGADAHGNLVAIPNRVWSVAALGGTIDSAGLFTAGTTAGTFTGTITATSGALSGTGTVTISAGALASIEITPATVTLGVGATQQYSAIGRDSSNNVVPVTPTWSAGSGGTIDSNGLFTAGTVAGTFGGTVHAMSGLISATSSVTVSPGALSSIAVSPLTTTLSSGATQSFTAVGTDAHANVVAITPVWSVVASGGTIDASTGVFTAGSTAGTFTNTVRATSGAISGTATVVVTVSAPTSITVTPQYDTLAVGGTQTFVAVGRDVNNVIVPITPVWSVEAGGGTIDASTGVFTAGTTTGTFTHTVQATVGSVWSIATVTVLAGPAARIQVTPFNQQLQAGGIGRFTATGYDAYNNVTPITVVWSVVAGGGTINQSGVFTAQTTAGDFPGTVKATSGSMSSTARVIVGAASLTSIVVTPANPTVLFGATQQFTATGYDAYMNVAAFPPTWSASPSAGTITGGGLFTPASGADGLYTNAITASFGSVIGRASVTVNCGC